MKKKSPNLHILFFLFTTVSHVFLELSLKVTAEVSPKEKNLRNKTPRETYSSNEK